MLRLTKQHYLNLFDGLSVSAAVLIHCDTQIACQFIWAAPHIFPRFSDQIDQLLLLLCTRHLHPRYTGKETFHLVLAHCSQQWIFQQSTTTKAQQQKPLPIYKLFYKPTMKHVKSNPSTWC